MKARGVDKKRKQFIILTVIMILAGLSSVLYGRYLKKTIDNAGITSTEAVTSDDIGRYVSIYIDQVELIEGGDGLYCIQVNLPNDEYNTIPVRGYAPDQTVSSTSGIGNDGYVTFIVKKTSEGIADQIAELYNRMYRDNLTKLYSLRDNGVPEGSNITPEFLDNAIALFEEAASEEGYRSILDSVTDYELDVCDMRLSNALITIGTVMTALMLMILFYTVASMRISVRKLAAWTAAVIVIGVLAVCMVIYDDIQTMLSLKEYAPDIYTIHVSSDYKLDKILEDGSYNESSLVKWVSENMFWNIPISVDLSKFSCASFACRTPDGTHIFGRNYDFQYTDPIIIYTEPENGYRAMAVSDLAMLNLAGISKQNEPDSLYGRAVLRAVPFLTSDGINEAGLGVSILSVGFTDMSQHTGKTGLYLPVGVRAILDTCASVDEAIELLESYDIKAMIGWSYHLFITDKSGRSVVAEWVRGELVITETDAVTNFLISAEKHDYCDRYETITTRLAEKDNVLTYTEAMELLMDSSQDSDNINTEWSCVYDLDNFKMYFVSDRDITDTYEITPDSF